ncbi:MAG: hypothetical protein IJL17_09935 [Kiritimatiellae bacterium]|nr:hypothetical protein [Kiritimatiellia bacterium]
MKSPSIVTPSDAFFRSVETLPPSSVMATAPSPSEVVGLVESHVYVVSPTAAATKKATVTTAARRRAPNDATAPTLSQNTLFSFIFRASSSGAHRSCGTQNRPNHLYVGKSYHISDFSVNSKIEVMVMAKICLAVE